MSSYTTPLKLFFLCVIVCLLASCQTVKPYQRMYLNDPDMQIGTLQGAKYEYSVQTYREGAAGAKGSSAGGGCGV